MNMVEATVARQQRQRRRRRSAAQTLDVDSASVADAPALADYDGRTVILGIRPEHLEDAALVARHTARPAAARDTSSCARRSARS